jgi:threonine dehydratase
MQADYLKRILTARVYDVAQETSVEVAPNLSARLQNTLLLKREDMQSVFSFKLRGAYNKMAQLSPEKLAEGVIAASAGNHAQGVALGASRLGARIHQTKLRDSCFAEESSRQPISLIQLTSSVLW